MTNGYPTPGATRPSPAKAGYGPRRQVIILAGHQNRRPDDLGACQEGEANGRPFYGIFLDNPHPKEVEAVNRPLEAYLRKTCTNHFLKRIWYAYLVQIYLHEHSGKAMKSFQQQVAGFSGFLEAEERLACA